MASSMERAGYAGTGTEGIDGLAFNCTTLFYKCLSTPWLATASLRLEELRQRFDAWVSYLGVLADSHASLEYRLRFSEEIRTMVVELLLLLERNLTRIVASEPEDLTEPLDSLKGGVERLHRIAVAIRKSSTASLASRIKAFSETHDDEDYFYSLAFEISRLKFPDSSIGICKHLAVSIKFRRQTIRYQRRHQQKLKPRPEYMHVLGSPLDQTPGSRAGPPTVTTPVAPHTLQNLIAPPSHTSASTFMVQDFPRHYTKPPPKPNKPLPPPSVISTGSTVIDHNNLPYPKPPVVQDGEQALCDWCFERHSAERYRNSAWWRHHILTSLKPYTCISEECKDPPLLFSKESEWRDHLHSFHGPRWSQEVYRPLQWCCDIGHSAPLYFVKEKGLEEHLVETHSDIFAREQIPTVLNQNSLPSLREPHVCPLCDSVPESLRQLLSGSDASEGQSGTSDSRRLPGDSGGSLPNLRKVTFDGGLDETSDEEDSAPQAKSLTHLGLSDKEFLYLVELERHIAGHLRSLAFISIRNLVDEDESSSNASAQALLERESRRSSPGSQGGTSDHSALVFEDISLSDRIFPASSMGEEDSPILPPAQQDWSKILGRIHAQIDLTAKQQDGDLLDGKRALDFLLSAATVLSYTDWVLSSQTQTPKKEDVEAWNTRIESTAQPSLSISIWGTTAEGRSLWEDYQYFKRTFSDIRFVNSYELGVSASTIAEYMLRLHRKAATIILTLLSGVDGNDEDITSAFTRQHMSVLNALIRDDKPSSFSDGVLALVLRESSSQREPSASMTGGVIIDQHLLVNFVREWIATGNGREIQTRGRSSTKKIIESLAFSTMRAREDSIPQAYNKTFEWIFEEPTSVGVRWSSFREWLMSGSEGIYWVSGKAGAGKSTLLKFILHDPRLKSILSVGGDKVLNAGFFFNALGTSLDNSIEGCLRSLLYQYLELHPEMASLVFPRRWLSSVLVEDDVVLPPCSVQELIDGLMTLVAEMAPYSKMLAIIDGLDEFSGNHSELVTLLKTIEMAGNVKLCVSSRPWNVFMDAFHTSPRFMLQDLTRDDINIYVQGRLGNNIVLQPSAADHLADDITSRAAGCFLWVSLVLRSILEGLLEGDTISDLQATIDSLPTDLEHLFHSIWSRVNPRYRSQASLYLQIKEFADICSMKLYASTLYLADIDQSLANAFNKSSDTAENATRMIERRVRSRTGGLLEIHRDSDDLVRSQVEYLHRTVRDWLLLNSQWEMMKRETSGRLKPYCALLKGEALRYSTGWAFTARVASAEFFEQLSGLFSCASRISDQDWDFIDTVRLLDGVDSAITDRWQRLDVEPAIRTLFGDHASFAGSHWCTAAIPSWLNGGERSNPPNMDFVRLMAQIPVARYVENKVSGDLNHSLNRDPRLLESALLGGHPNYWNYCQLGPRLRGLPRVDLVVFLLRSYQSDLGNVRDLLSQLRSLTEQLPKSKENYTELDFPPHISDLEQVLEKYLQEGDASAKGKEKSPRRLLGNIPRFLTGRRNIESQ